MKFAPFHILLLCLLLCSIACNESTKETNKPDTKQNILPDSQPNHNIEKDQDFKPRPETIKPTKEQLDRAIEKKNKTSILDSLKPKTA